MTWEALFHMPGLQGALPAPLGRWLAPAALGAYLWLCAAVAIAARRGRGK